MESFTNAIGALKDCLKDMGGSLHEKQKDFIEQQNELRLMNADSLKMTSIIQELKGNIQEKQNMINIRERELHEIRLLTEKRMAKDSTKEREINELIDALREKERLLSTFNENLEDKIRDKDDQVRRLTMQLEIKQEAIIDL